MRSVVGGFEKRGGVTTNAIEGGPQPGLFFSNALEVLRIP
jgi:hypothetical protein